MNNFMELLERRLMPLAEVISRNKYLIATRDGFLVNMPLLIIGSFFMLINNFPIKPWTDFLSNTTLNGTSLSALLSVPTNATYSIMAIFVVIGIGYNFAKQMKVNPLFSAATAVVGWFMLMPFSTSFTPEGSKEIFQVSSLPLEWIGARGIFIGIICSFVAVHIYKFVSDKGWVIKMPAGVPSTVTSSFASLIPIALVMTSFLVIHLIFKLTPWDNAFNFIFQFLQLPLQHIGDSLGAMVIIYLFAHILWFFGIHGTNVVNAIWGPILSTMGVANLEAFRAGNSIPYIISDAFNTVYGICNVYVIVIAVWLAMRSRRMKSVAKVASVPAMFCISEPMVFGLPIFMNPILMIPYILCSSVQFAIAYVLCVVGFAPVPVIPTPWTCPAFINVLLATNWNFMGVVTQVILIIVGVLIWLPFMKLLDKSFLKDEEGETAQIQEA